ncbi:hypothetical protein [Streptomyces sp. V4I2]|uniref:hypothetical protein n=1 Tax=Streptomyces sp. V4I2 TaxID=3042280 RepID=UPI002788AA3D|nr:hypothetical protein [Streptomyces sp. V4I2]MDQ1050744.1 hypothetical protein [Streptomyces sp. V4I2]
MERMTTLNAAQVLQRAAGRSCTDGAALPVPRNDQYLYTKEVTTRTYKDGTVKKYTDERWLSVDGSKPSRFSYYGRILDEQPLAKNEVKWPPTEYARLKKWPTDPDRLLERSRGWSRRGWWTGSANAPEHRTTHGSDCSAQITLPSGV